MGQTLASYNSVQQDLFWKRIWWSLR